MSSPSPLPSILAPASAFLERLETMHSSAWAGFALILGLFIYSSIRAKRQYDAIPAVGSTGIFSSYLSAIRYIRDAKGMLQEGYDKYQPGAFRIPAFNRWLVLVTGEELIEELRRAPNDVLSFGDATEEALAARYTLGPNFTANPYHVPIVRNQLTRNLGALFADVRNEIVLAFDDIIPATDDWTKVPALDAIMQIVSRTSNRLFIGAPKCRDPEYIALNIRFTIDVIIGASIINLFPNVLTPLAGRLFTNLPKATRIAIKHLGPIIEERQQKIDEYGLDYPDKPNDMLSWLMDEATGEERTVKNLARRILFLNFAAIHTSSMSFAHVLFDLASRPEYIPAIRAEVEAVVAEDGWSKAAMTRMRKLDSLLKESLRMFGIGAISLTRKAMKDYTFSDGTHVPKGGLVMAASLPHQLDDAVYPQGDVFDPFRFSDIPDQDGQGSMVATSAEYLAFGLGRHACPGRFFAANELKAMMAHVVLAYDIKMEKEGVRPKDQWYGVTCIPNRKAEVLFRRRR